MTTAPARERFPEHVDVAVLGAGITGCMVATQVRAHAPERSVLVVDRDTVAAGATRRSAGLHFPRGATPEVRRMAALSQDYYADLRAARPQLPIFPLPMTVVADPAGTAAVVEAYLPASLRALPARPDGSAAWAVAGGQYADVYELAQQLAAALRPEVEFVEGERVVAVRPGPDGVDVELGSGRTLHADQVVIAPGPWSADPAWHDLTAPLGVRVKKVVALHVRRPPAPDDGVVVFHDDDAFLLPILRRGHWLFSYTCQEWDVRPDALVDGIGADELARARACLARHAPDLAAHATGGRVFCDAYGPAGEPVVRRLDAAGRVVFAGACNGSGYRLAPAVALRTVELLGLSQPARRSA